MYTDGKGEQYASQTYARVAGEFEEGALVGRHTFGKGLVQQPITLSDGGELCLTIARYYTPAGRSACANPGS